MKKDQIPVKEEKVAHMVNERNVINAWGRKQVFIVSSFNDWVPIEMKTVHEIKMENKHGDALPEYIKENPADKECDKPSQNIMQAT